MRRSNNKNRWEDRQVVRHLEMGQKLFNIHCLVDKTMNLCGATLLRPTQKSLEQVLVGVLGLPGAFVVTERALLYF